MRKKGFIVAGLTATVLGVAIAVASVLIFFYVFKVSIDLQMREGYLWNKIQEIPMDLLSMDIGGESFVSKMNKVYYTRNDAEKNQLTNELNEKINKQLFYYFSGAKNPFQAFIKIAGIEITENLEGCMISQVNCHTEMPPLPSKDYCDCICSVECGATSGKVLGTHVEKGKCGLDYQISDCKYTLGTKVEYAGKFPFPLTFNGTSKIIDELSYNATEVK